MRMSCNGCRVLRKGCTDNCSIRPCLEWIKCPDSQAHATVFLAKFYGRAGLINLINAGPQHLRPAIFRSLLYEACGRLVNPIYGSVGLLWSGNWSLCQKAVEAVLKGAPITRIESEDAERNNGPPLKAYDIRHVSKGDSAGSRDLHRVRTRSNFKKSGVKKPKARRVWVGSGNDSGHEEMNRSTSHESSLSHQSEFAANVEVESLEASFLHRAEPKADAKTNDGAAEDGEVELDLTLGFEPISRSHHSVNTKENAIGRFSDSAADDGECRMELRL